MSNGPLTPPITECDAHALHSGSQAAAIAGEAGGSHPGASGVRRPSVYEQVFPELASLAMQGTLQSLINLAEKADFSVRSSSLELPTVHYKNDI